MLLVEVAFHCEVILWNMFGDKVCEMPGHDVKWPLLMADMTEDLTGLMRGSIGRVSVWWYHGVECHWIGSNRSILMIVGQGGWGPVGCSTGHWCSHASR